MTELETMQRAKMYLDKLAQGIDPITDRKIPEDSTLNNVRLSRCFFYVSDVLGQVIANGGVIGKEQRVEPFAITQVQLERVQLSQEPLRITQLIDRISAATDNPRMKKLKTTTVTDWLMKEGFLEKQDAPDGKSNRVPTQKGCAIGLSTVKRQAPGGEYLAVMYDLSAQRFVLDNLKLIMAER